jgi:hypothetical protein
MTNDDTEERFRRAFAWINEQPERRTEILSVDIIEESEDEQEEE